MPAPRTRRIRPVLLLVLIVVLAATAGHVVLWVSTSLLWIAFLAATVLFATGYVRRPRPRQDR